MSRQTTFTCPRSDRTNLYAEITDKIIAELEAGRVPWVQPWAQQKHRSAYRRTPRLAATTAVSTC